MKIRWKNLPVTFCFKKVHKLVLGLCDSETKENICPLDQQFSSFEKNFLMHFYKQGEERKLFDS